jgi:hypothetical protein
VRRLGRDEIPEYALRGWASANISQADEENRLFRTTGRS